MKEHEHRGLDQKDHAEILERTRIVREAKLRLGGYFLEREELDRILPAWHANDTTSTKGVAP